MEHALVRGGELLGVIAMLGGREKSHTKRETPGIRAGYPTSARSLMLAIVSLGRASIRMPNSFR